MKIVSVASDHAGVKVKEYVVSFLINNNYDYEDFSVSNKEGDDYPDFASEVARATIKRKSFGVLVCGTGIGMSIVANKHEGIRAALCRAPGDAVLSRKHNDANILVLSGKSKKKDVESILRKFLLTRFEGGRHLRRLKKIKLVKK